jgi:hypothetical protein
MTTKRNTLFFDDTFYGLVGTKLHGVISNKPIFFVWSPPLGNKTAALFFRSFAFKYLSQQSCDNSVVKRRATSSVAGDRFPTK